MMLPRHREGLDDLLREHQRSGMPRSRWLHDREFETYMRVGPRYVQGTRGLYVTIANMTALQPRRGGMRSLFDLTEVFGREHGLGVCVECVQNLAIIPFILGRGYWHDASSDPLGDGMGNYHLGDRP